MPEHVRFVLTEHAATVILARGIDPQWIERVLANPERLEPDRDDLVLRHALGGIVERGDRVLRVVYNAHHEPPRVITAYFDRRQGRKR
jgi:hypothetical protein